MNKEEYLAAIREKIKSLPEGDIDRTIEYYDEMIDDRMEDGLTEEEAVADMASPDEVSMQVLEDIPLSRLVKERIKPKHELKGWQIALIVIGSPVWIPLVLTALVLLLTFWIVVVSLLVAYYSVILGVAAAGVSGLIMFIFLLISSNTAAGFLMLGLSLVVMGLSILLIVSAKPVTKAMFKCCRAGVIGIKRIFVKER